MLASFDVVTAGTSSRRSGLVRVWSVIFSITLVACGGNGDGDSAQGTPATAEVEGPEPSGPTSSTLVPDNVDSAKGIVALMCSGTLTVTVVDPNNGRLVAKRERGEVSDHKVTFCDANRVSTYVQRQSLDESFNRVAVTINTGRTEQGRSETSVGFIDTRTGRLTDLTGRPPSDSFGSRPAQVHSSPVFKPDSDEIWFLDRSEDQPKLASVSANGGPVTSRGPYNHVQEVVSDVPSFYLAPRTNAVIVHTSLHPEEDLLPNPSGTLALHRFFNSGCENTSRERSVGGACRALRVYDLRGGLIEADPEGRPKSGAVRGTVYFGNESPVVPVGWIDERSVLFQEPAGENFRVGTFSEGYDSIAWRDVLPRNDKDNRNPIVSREGRQIVFTSDGRLYRAATDGASDPREIATEAPFGSLSRPVEWRD